MRRWRLRQHIATNVVAKFLEIQIVQVCRQSIDSLAFTHTVQIIWIYLAIVSQIIAIKQFNTFSNSLNVINLSHTLSSDSYSMPFWFSFSFSNIKSELNEYKYSERLCNICVLYHAMPNVILWMNEWNGKDNWKTEIA